MSRSIRHFALIRMMFSVFGGAVLGSFLGFAAAQDRTGGQLDSACASDCAASGYDAKLCGQVCWVPDPGKAAKGEAIDWRCMTGCRERGGKLADCRLSCRRP